MQAYRLILLVGTLGVALAVSACNDESYLNLTTPSQVNTGKMEVKDQMATETLSADHIDQKGVVTVAQHILRNGNEDVTLTIPYLPDGKAQAGYLGAVYQHAFEEQGLTHSSVNMVPVTDSQYAKNVLVSYKTLVASQPKDCGRIPGYQGTETLEGFGDYRYGCEVNATISKMVDDPADLLGKTNPPEANSRRNGAIIDPYQAGTPNQPIKGMQASTVGQ